MTSASVRRLPSLSAGETSTQKKNAFINIPFGCLHVEVARRDALSAYASQRIKRYEKSFVCHNFQRNIKLNSCNKRTKTGYFYTFVLRRSASRSCSQRSVPHALDSLSPSLFVSSHQIQFTRHLLCSEAFQPIRAARQSRAGEIRHNLLLHARRNVIVANNKDDDGEMVLLCLAN